MSRRTPSNQVVVLRLPPFVVVTFLLLLAVAGPFFLLSWWNSHGVSQRIGRFSTQLGRNVHSSNHRIAIVIPFIGKGPEAIPTYLELFCSGAAGSAGLVDFLLIHNGVMDGYRGTACPENVKFISLGTMENFSRHLVRVMEGGDENDEPLTSEAKDRLARILTKHIANYPYVMVEFKPALGHVFAEYLKDYTHWGYSDLDILFGDLERWITPEELTDFDIVTYGYGDQERLYVRGQFTFHKNEEKINQIWRACDYLSQMDMRFEDVMEGRSRLHFESAEGCYSAAILGRNDIRVKYAHKAFTDVEGEDTAYTHGLYIGTGRYRDRSVVYKAGSRGDGKKLAKLSDAWFEMKNTVYSDTRKPLQQEVGDREQLAVVAKEKAKCMYWAQEKYQSKLCIDDVDSTDTVFWLDGRLYKQKHETALFPDNLITAPFFHFQEWKRYYRANQLAPFHRESKARTFVLTKEGVIPIYPIEYKHDKHFVPSYLGLELSKWNGVKGDDREFLPSYSYCLHSGPRKTPPKPPAPQCQYVSSWRDKETVEIISGAPEWKHLDANTEVTLGLTLQITAEQAANQAAIDGILDLITMYLNRWQGQPCVLLIHVAGANPEVAAKLRNQFGPASSLANALETCLVAAIFDEGPEFVSRKALLNMVVDASPTRWVLSGFELERGIVISHDTAFFAHRSSRIYEDLPGHIFVVPHFGFVEGEGDFTIPKVLEAKQAGNLNRLSKFEMEFCEGGEDSDAGDDGGQIFEPIVDMWWKLTEAFVTGQQEAVVDEKGILLQRALTLDDIQLSIIGLLTDAKHYNLFAMDASPILMVDNLGPRNGMITSELVREVEEFGGKQCYNGLRLAQLATLGYTVNVMAGAYAASSAETRAKGQAEKGASGTSRCDGCFLFDVEHEDILEDISKDERKRPAKANLLWDHTLYKEPQLEGHT